MTSANNSLEKELKALIKEAILNKDVEMLESLLEGQDKELLQELVWFAALVPVLKGLGAAATVGGTVWASDALGVTDNWYDKAVKYVDPTHYAVSAFSGKNNPMFGESPDRMKSGWLTKGVGNMIQGKDFGDGIEVENKSEFTKKAESGNLTERDVAQRLFDAMDGAGSGVDTVKSILQLNPNAKPGSAEELQMAVMWTAIHKEFDNVTKAEDDGDKDRDLVWWLEDEGDFPEEAAKMKEFLAIMKKDPEELGKRYSAAAAQPDASVASAGAMATGGTEASEDAADTESGSSADAAKGTAGFALLGMGAKNIKDEQDAANSMWSAYNTLKDKPAGERSKEENELLGILGQAAAS